MDIRVRYNGVVGGDQMKDYIQAIIDYVEVHIYDDLNIDVIAAHVGYSKYYLNKVFGVYTGMSIMYFVRKRKLEHAMEDLKTKEPIIDIAIKYAFHSRKSFTRAFTSMYQQAPSTFRSNVITLPTKMILHEIGGIRMVTYLSEPTEVSIEPLHVLSHTIVSKNPEDEVARYMCDYATTHQLTTLRRLGADSPIDEDKQLQGYRGYEYWLVVAQEEYQTHTPKDVTKKIIQGSNYLSLRIDNPFADPFERIPNGWKKLAAAFHDDYTYNDIPGGMCFEEVLEVDGKVVMDIFIPFQSECKKK